LTRYAHVEAVPASDGDQVTPETLLVLEGWIGFRPTHASAVCHDNAREFLEVPPALLDAQSMRGVALGLPDGLAA
jgi:hypothetical protein